MKIRLGFANVVSFLALFVALSASSYAAIATVQANSVGTKQIKKGAVTRAKLATGSVDGSKVVQGSLTGADIDLSTLGTVPSAATANAAPIARVLIVTASGTNEPATDSSGNVSAATATCPSGTFVLGGGTQLSDQQAQVTNDTYPSANNAWTADVFNGGPGSPGFTVYAICGPAAATH
jgi:hypothetical protein